MPWLAKIRALLIIIIENIFTCFILAVVPIGYDPLLDQAGMTANLLVINCMLQVF